MNKFEKVKAVHADTFYRSVQETRSDSTAFGYFRMAKAMLTYLESRELVDRNPFFRVKYQRPEFQHSEIPDLKQVNRILDQVEPKFLVPISALAFMGCRREALTRVLTTDVDRDAGTIFVRKPEGVTSKTVSRRVPIHRRLAALLDTYERPESKWFFCSPWSPQSPGGKKIDGDDLNEAFKRAVKKAGYPAGRKNKGYTLHCLRGFFKSHALKCGVPREIVDVIQGHRSDRSVGTRHYLQFTQEDLNRFMQSINFDSQEGE